MYMYIVFLYMYATVPHLQAAAILVVPTNHLPLNFLVLVWFQFSTRETSMLQKHMLNYLQLLGFYLPLEKIVAPMYATVPITPL